MRKRSSEFPREVPVFLLGSGAVVESGMPNVYALTRKVLRRLSKADKQLLLPIIKALQRSAPRKRINLEHLVDALEVASPNTERPWLRRLLQPRFRIATDAADRLIVTIRRVVATLFLAVPSLPSLQYLQKLRHFKVDGKPVHIFTTNFDLCLETALEAAGVKPHVELGERDGVPVLWEYLAAEDCVNLYKLHGSVDWYDEAEFFEAESRGFRLMSELHPVHRYKLWLWPTWHAPLTAVQTKRYELAHCETLLSRSPDVAPQIVLGTMEKVLTVEPYFFLLECFRRALWETEFLVIIGYGWGDKHINRAILEAWLRNPNGLKLIVVSPSPGQRFRRLSNLVESYEYRYFRMTARKALESNALLNYFYKGAPPRFVV